jgi:hypothetical protein
MEFLLIGLTVLSVFASGVALAAVFTAGNLHGQHKLLNKMIVDSRRRERRNRRDIETWQSKFLEKSGVGTLRRRVYQDTEAKLPVRRFVSPSEAINELKKEQSTGIKQVPRPKETVPVTIAGEFLQDAAQVAVNAGNGNFN